MPETPQPVYHIVTLTINLLNIANHKATGRDITNLCL